MTTTRLIKSVGRSSSRLALLLIPLVFACFAFLPQTQAALPPEIPGNPDGCYPAFNTAEGCNALADLGLGIGNTGVGWYALSFVVDGSLNTAVGAGALDLNRASNNTAVGSAALFLNETGTGNTAVGAGALAFNNADLNTAVGLLALDTNTIGTGNTAVGAGTLAFNDADGNTGVGAGVLAFNTSGKGNTALGAATLVFNTESSGNTAVGAQALKNNTGPPGFFGDSSLNTAVGVNALTENTSGKGNTAVGAGPGLLPQPSPDPPLLIPSALGSNTTGSQNTAVGASEANDPAALGRNTTGHRNTAVGSTALNSNTIGERNIAVGYDAGSNLTTGDGNIDIGNSGNSGEWNTIRIGPFAVSTLTRTPSYGAPTGSPTPTPTPTPSPRTFIAGIRGARTENTDAINVVIDSMGQLGTMSSSVRFKKEIKTMDKASEAILALKPVTFQYKSDNTNTPQFGLIAEEVAKVNPNLVVRDKDGQIYTVRYDAVNAMLLNEFLKEHKAFIEEQRKVQEQEATITQLKQDFQSRLAHQQKQIEALTAGLQKVSAQLQASKPAPQMVENNR